MRLTSMQAIVIMLCIILGVQLTRALPFALFPENRKQPALIAYLGKTIPPAVMGMLVVYALKGITPLVWPHGLPELLALAATVGVHLWKRNTLLSILIGTVLYMVLIQQVF